MIHHERDEFLRTAPLYYGWGDALRVTPQLGGYVAEVFLIETAAHVGWLKCYDRQRAITQRVLADASFYLQTTAWLHCHSLVSGRIVAPIPTTDGEYLVDNGGRYAAVMFDYIIGQTPRETPLTSAQRQHLVTTVALLHAATPDVPFVVPHVVEDFSAPWVHSFGQMLETQWERFDLDVRAVLSPHRDNLQAMLVRFVQAGHQWRIHQPAMVLCHTDIHGYNVIVNGNDTYLLDFEGLKLAPPEHDFMFWVDDVAWSDILVTYQHIRPGIVPDKRLIRFYQERRVLEDVYDYLEQLLVEPLTPDRRAEICMSLRQMLVMIA